jgi:hypothetical protein
MRGLIGGAISHLREKLPALKPPARYYLRDTCADSYLLLTVTCAIAACADSYLAPMLALRDTPR